MKDPSLEFQQSTTPLRSSVESGIITSTLTSEGNVIADAPDVYIENIFVDFGHKYNAKYFSTPHQIGVILKKGDLLYTFKGKEVKTAYDCKIVDMVIDDYSANFSLLIYDKLFIVTSVDYDKLNYLDFNTKTELTLNIQGEKERYTGKIINFGYEVKNGKVEVRIHCDEKLLPGTPLNVSFEIVHQTESLYILKQMLLMDGDTYYVEVEDGNGQRTRKEVEIGEFFDNYDNEHKVEYVEIKSGLELGERLIIDIVE